MKIAEFINLLHDLEVEYPDADIKCQDPYKLTTAKPEDIVKVKGNIDEVTIYYGDPKDFK